MRGTLDQELAERDRQLEAARTCATGIEEKHAVPPLEARFVRVPGNHHLHAERRRIDAKLAEIVNHIDADRAESERLGFGQRLGPSPGIVVAADRAPRG